MSDQKYDREFKLEAVRRTYEENVTTKEVAQELGIARETLYYWRSQFKKEGVDAFPGKGFQTPEKMEIASLKRENQRLKMEQEILKKALRVFAKE